MYSVIKTDSCCVQCYVPTQWISQRQVGTVSVYCDGVGCHILWKNIGQSTTTTCRYRHNIASDVKAM